MENKDQEFLEYLVRAIVNNPNEVRTTRIVDERGVLITLDINSADMGYVIGRQGQTARAIRTLLKIVGAKNNARVNLKINEPPGGRRSMMGGLGMGNAMGMNMNASMSPAGRMTEEIDTSAVDNLTI